MVKKKTDKNLKKIAFSEMFLLVISIVAISYALGSEVGVVSSAGSACPVQPTPEGFCQSGANQVLGPNEKTIFTTNDKGETWFFGKEKVTDPSTISGIKDAYKPQAPSATAALQR